MENYPRVNPRSWKRGQYNERIDDWLSEHRDDATGKKVSCKRRYQLRQMVRGLCLHCTEPVSAGKRLCVRHLELNRQHSAKTYARKKSDDFSRYGMSAYKYKKQFDRWKKRLEHRVAKGQPDVI
jgi:hypothetical protein